jgi:hypothetical protein
MTGKNRYYRHSKISQAKFCQLLRLFALDLTATDAAQLCHLSVRSTNDIHQRIRVRLQALGEKHLFAPQALERHSHAV